MKLSWFVLYGLFGMKPTLVANANLVTMFLFSFWILFELEHHTANELGAFSVSEERCEDIFSFRVLLGYEKRPLSSSRSRSLMRCRELSLVTGML